MYRINVPAIENKRSNKYVSTVWGFLNPSKPDPQTGAEMTTPQNTNQPTFFIVFSYLSLCMEFVVFDEDRIKRKTRLSNREISNF